MSRSRSRSRSRGRDRGRGGGGQRMSLYVKGISAKISPDDVKEAFGKYGDIKDVYIPRDYYTKEPKEFGYVQFEDERDAKDALAAMDGVEFHGRRLIVQIAKGDRKNANQMRDKESGGRRPAYRRRSRSRSYSRGRGRRRSRSRSRSRGRRRRSRSRDRSRDRRSYGRDRRRSPRGDRDRPPRRSRTPPPRRVDRSRSASPAKRSRSPAPAPPRDDAGDKPRSRSRS